MAGLLASLFRCQDDTICNGEPTTITAYGFGGNYDQYTYTWRYGTEVLKVETNPISLLIVNPTTPGNHIYTVEVFDGYNTFPSTITIYVAPSPSFSIVGAPLIIACPADTVILHPGTLFPGASYYWSNGSTDANLRLTTTGIGYSSKDFEFENKECRRLRIFRHGNGDLRFCCMFRNR